MRLATVLLMILAAPQPVFAAEQPLSPVTYGPPPIRTGSVALGIASDGRDSETLWTDNVALYATHSDASGTPVSQVRLGVRPPGQYAAIVWSGAAYIVLWFDGSGSTIVATIDRNGTLMTPPHSVVIGAPRNTMQPIASASNGRTVFIAFVEDATTLHAALLDRNGNVIRAFIVISPPLGADQTLAFSQYVAAATDGSDYMLFWAATKQNAPAPYYFSQIFRATRIPSAGDTATTSDPLATYIGAYRFDAAFAHGRYVLLVPEGSSLLLHRIAVNAITLQATPLAESNEPYDAYLISDGDRFVAYRMRTELQVATFTGDPSEGPVHFASTDVASGYRVYMTATNGGYVVAWANNDGVFSAVLDRDFKVLGQSRIALAPVSQNNPSIANANGQSLIVWFEPTAPDGSSGAIRAARVADNGAILDHEPLLLTPDAKLARPAVASIAGGYFTAWLGRDGTIHGRRVERDGTLRESRGELPSIDPPALAANTTTILLVAGSKTLTGMRLNADGTAIDAVPLVVATGPAYNAQVGSNRSDFLVVWTDQLFYSPKYQPKPRNVFGARVNEAGDVLDPAPIAIATTAADKHDPAIGSDGRDYVIAYQSYLNFATAIMTKRVLREGQLADTTADSPGAVVGDPALYSGAPAIAPTTDGYLLVFADTSANLQLQHLDEHGIADRAPVTVATATATLQSPIALAAVGADFCAVYQRYFDDGHSPIVPRLVLRAPDLLPRRRAVK